MKAVKVTVLALHITFTLEPQFLSPYDPPTIKFNMVVTIENIHKLKAARTSI